MRISNYVLRTFVPGISLQSLCEFSVRGFFTLWQWVQLFIINSIRLSSPGHHTYPWAIALVQAMPSLFWCNFFSTPFYHLFGTTALLPHIMQPSSSDNSICLFQYGLRAPDTCISQPILINIKTLLIIGSVIVACFNCPDVSGKNSIWQLFGLEWPSFLQFYGARSLDNLSTLSGVLVGQNWMVQW